MATFGLQPVTVSVSIRLIQRMAFFFSSFDPVPDDENHIFLALCEVSPGVIWAGGFTSGIYKIEKKKGFKISYLSPAAIAGVRPDQYILT